VDRTLRRTGWTTNGLSIRDEIKGRHQLCAGHERAGALAIKAQLAKLSDCEPTVLSAHRMRGGLLWQKG